MSKLFAFAIAVCCVTSAPFVEYDDGSKEMVSTVYVSDSPAELVTGLVGDIAQDIQASDVHKGPKVNGGFATNVNPVNKEEKRVANADCAGHIVDGKCVRLFPKRSRTATIDDNMLSPEQLSASLYEPDIHQMVKTHFNQNVMEETSFDSHHVGMPGFEVIETEMNKDTNTHANSISDSLFPIGSTMMQSGDSELNVDLAGMMNHVVAEPTLSHVTQSDRSSESQISQQETSQQSSGEAQSGQNAQAVAVDTQAAAAAHEVAQGAQYPVTVVHVPAQSTTSEVLSNGSQEIAEPQTGQPSLINDDEVGDLESFVPQESVEAEAGLPPTPTPLPTPDPEEIRKAQLAAEEHTKEIAACVAVLEQEGLVCASSNQEVEQTFNPVVNVQVEAPKAPEPLTPPFDVNDVKGNYQRMISFCVNKASQDFAVVSENAQTDSHLLIQKRTRFSQTLVKFASAMSCMDSEDFPSCMPSEASHVIQTAPVHGQWSCF